MKPHVKSLTGGQKDLVMVLAYLITVLEDKKIKTYIKLVFSCFMLFLLVFFMVVLKMII